MAKLNQIIAVCNGKKSRATKELTEVHKELQKSDLLNGISRTYQPSEENGEQLPPESKNVQVKVTDKIRQIREVLIVLIAKSRFEERSARCEFKSRPPLFRSMPQKLVSRKAVSRG